MPTINYNAALPAFSSISGRSSIDINKWVSELKFNISSLIKSLFANGEQGFFYDPNDLSTMYQDAAGTIPVTGVGQPVGLILDKSGRNNHAFQTNSASRPILRQNAATGAYYLEFYDSDDFLVTNSIDFTATDEVSLFTGVRLLSGVQANVIAELSDSLATNDNSFALIHGSAYPIRFFSRGSLTSAAGTGSSFPPPQNLVIRAKASISKDINNLKIGNTVYTSNADQGTGTYGNYPLYIGRRGGSSLPFSGHIYSLIGIGRLTTDSEAVVIEKELAKRTGVTLSV